MQPSLTTSTKGSASQYCLSNAPSVVLTQLDAHPSRRPLPVPRSGQALVWERLHVAGAERGERVEEMRQTHASGFSGKEERVRLSVEAACEARLHGSDVVQCIGEDDLFDDHCFCPKGDAG